MKTVIKIMLSSALSINMFLSTVNTAFCADNDTMDNKITSEQFFQETGISNNLIKIMEESDNNTLIPVDIWIKALEIENIEAKVKKKIGYNKNDIIKAYERNNFDTKPQNTFSTKQIDLYIETERNLYSSQQACLLSEFIESCTETPNLQEAFIKDNIFISHYAPVINVELTTDEIKNLSEREDVEVIYYSPKSEIVAETNLSIPLIRANYTRDSLNLRGNGIRIGMFDLGAPNNSLSYLMSSNIHYDTDESTRIYNSHSNSVAAILTGNSSNYTGIVPDAQLYSTYRKNGEDWRNCIEWLLDNNVNIINMSCGLNSSDGTYGSSDQWVDHIAINHSVHFVKSAGNNEEILPNSLVTSPGLAFNVITVGGIDDNNSSAQSDDTFASSSCYKSATSGTTNKPDLVAPSVSISTAAGTKSGTSFAAPHVTAVVAQLCQKSPSLKVMQDSVKSIITAGINHSIISYDATNVSDYNKMGAGCVDAQGAYYIANNSRFISSTFAANSANGSVRNYNFNVSSSDSVIRVSLSWLKYATVSGNHTSNDSTLGTLADLDLKVYDKNGNLVRSSVSSQNNTETIKISNPSTALNPYRIEVKQYSNSNYTVYYTVSWY